MNNIYKVLNIATVKHDWKKQSQLGFYCVTKGGSRLFLEIFSESTFAGELQHIGTSYFKPEISKNTETNIL